MLEIQSIPLLQDNYAWLLLDDQSGITAVVDPSEDVPVRELLQRRQLGLTFVLNTHHHHDHTGGNLGLKEAFRCEIIGPEYDRGRIAGMDRGVRDGDEVMIGSYKARVIYIPGHTRGHIAFWFREAEAVFCGDTLFTLGCGRLFEGTPEQMWDSLSKLGALPPQTRVYCGHEYTAANARFALTVEEDNAALRARAAQVTQLRERNQPTVPATIGDEIATNPFLRAKDAERFGELRRLKDHF